MFNRAIRCGVQFDSSYEYLNSPVVEIEDGLFVERNPLEGKRLFNEEMFKIANLQAAGVNLEECHIECHDTLENINRTIINMDYIAVKHQEQFAVVEDPKPNVESAKPNVESAKTDEE